MKHLGLIAKFLMTAALLWLIASQIDFAELQMNIIAFTSLGLGTVFLVLAAQQIVAAWRLSVVMSMIGEELSLLTAIRINLIGFFFGQTFLSFIGCDAARLWELSRENVSARDATRAVLLDRLLGLIANHILVLTLLLWTLELVEQPAPRLAVVAVAAGGAAGIALLVVLAWMRGKLGLEKRLVDRFGAAGIVSMFFDLISVLRVSFGAPMKTLGALALGIVINAMNAAMIYLLFADLGAEISLIHCLALVPLIMEMALVPISIAGWGVREGLMVVAFGMAGAAAGVAFSVSIMFGLMGVAFGLLGCAVWLMRRPEERIGARTPQE